MKKFLFLTLGFALVQAWFTQAWAQEPNMSQYTHTPFLTNPGMIGVMDQASIIANHRNQSVDAGQTYATSTISAYYPISIGNHRLGLGASFLSDRVADFMGTNGGMLGTAYSVQLSRKHELSLGAQAGFFNRKLNAAFSFTTDSQFQNGGFNADAPTGEIFVEQSRNFTTLTTGLFWQMKDEQGRQLAFAGGSIFNFNQPNVGFDEESKLPVSMKATAGLRVFQGDRLSVVPNVRWLSTADAQMINTGSWFRYDLSQSIEYPQQLSLGAWYNSNKAGVFALEYEKSSYLIGISYDIPMLSDLSTMQQGGIFEVALSLKIGNKRPKQVRATTPVETSPVTLAPAKEVVPEPEVPARVEKPTKVERLQGNQLSNEAPALAVQKRELQLAESDRVELKKTVSFELSYATLTPDSRAFLDDIADIFKRNETLKIQLVGHTCSIGTERDNEKLSVERAEVVKQYLQSKGIAAERILVKGAGEQQPIVSNSTEEGRIQNRRVEFQIIDQP
ncbi:type IX secretion system PorP/SprF family membrane protein [Catalinimonas alkaloidigena]|uniref:PorP/SprF family type IX secretion system membrane protein n=1 Tax=Catalinimonas alkaloidigena TaxID=1075417 RepID=UPI0024061B46|nr:PorP/SprF family type IX secretion system membrane protein [Catalinimonas alkaloidigena]MDF9797890.1 type IX secretion system PorP/SprF family membrane protein [Catalinimonas alkaloidigena]